MNKRASGVLMHITSLPGDYGIGSFGQAAYDFVDFLKETKQTYWQILPLTTTSYGDSPYQSFSAVAGNTHFIDLDFLIRDKFLTKADVKGADFGSDPEFIDYAKVYEARRPILEKAVKAILADKKEAKKFEAFKTKNANWLADYADFMAIKEHFDNKALQDWDDKKAVKRDEATLEKLRKELADVITYHQVVQYLFFSQWAELKAYANKNGIQIIGDMPIYISADSVEVWTQPHLFKLDAECKPRYIAGVPPDNFSATGQLWGNPIYAWDKHKAETALRDYAQLLILPFGEYSPEMANWKREKPVVPVWNHREDAKLELWYPHGEIPFECAVVSGSLRSSLIYYRQRILDAGMVMRTCSQCGRVFFAPDTRSNLCSGRCRKASKKAAKKSFDSKSRDEEYEQAYKREYMFWYNRVKKLEKNHVSREQLEKAQSALKQFRKEAGKRKKQIQNGELSTVQFMNWMIGQEAIIQEICGG